MSAGEVGGVLALDRAIHHLQCCMVDGAVCRGLAGEGKPRAGASRGCAVTPLACGHAGTNVNQHNLARWIGLASGIERRNCRRDRLAYIVMVAGCAIAPVIEQSWKLAEV